MSEFNWLEASQGGAATSAPIEEGFHFLRAVKVVRTKKDGEPFTTRDGAPQVMVVMENQSGREHVEYFTCNDAAGWKLAQFLRCAGANLDAMQKDGITPERFADKVFAEKQLIDRECWGQAYQNGKYINVRFLDVSEVPTDILKSAEKPDHGEIPF